MAESFAFIFAHMDFMITYRLPIEFDKEMIKTIPAHRAKVNRLIDSGVIKAYSLSLKRETLWMVVEAVNENDLEAILQSLPLSDHLLDYEVEPLMFSLSANTEIPHISMN